MEDTKKCSKCRKVKPFGEYKQCQTCLEYCRFYSKNNPEKEENGQKKMLKKQKRINR